MKTYKGTITSLKPNEFFVFGSNTQGRHGKGAALIARTRFGAKYGQAYGMQGNSYAIVTKNLIKPVHPSVPLGHITAQIKVLYQIAKEHPECSFYVAYSATGSNLNGYSPEQMAQMFSCTTIPDNLVFEEGFAQLITTAHS